MMSGLLSGGLLSVAFCPGAAEYELLYRKSGGWERSGANTAANAFWWIFSCKKAWASSPGPQRQDWSLKVKTRPGVSRPRTYWNLTVKTKEYYMNHGQVYKYRKLEKN